MKPLAAVLVTATLISTAAGQAAKPAGQPAGQPAAQPASNTQLLAVLQWLLSEAANRAAAQAGSSMPKQTQSISIDHGSTTLIDQSSATDLLSAALNLTPISSGTAAGASGASGSPGSGSVTASAYAIRQLFHKNENPLDPKVYNTHGDWRRVFFTVGREQLNTSSSSPSGTSSPMGSAIAKATTSTGSSTTPQPGIIAGFQVLLLQQRDASNIRNNKTAMAELQSIALDASKIYAKYSTRLINAICGQPANAACLATAAATGDNVVKPVQDLVDKLPASGKTAVNQIVSDYITEYQRANTDQRLTMAIADLQGKPQVALNFTSTQRTGGLPNDYVGELIFDRGLSKYWHFTLNGSYDYTDSPIIGADLRTERVAVELSHAFNLPAPVQKSPFQLNLSGEGVHQNTGYHYRAQLQVVIPIMTGLNFPISAGYGNETDALRQEEKGVFGKFGFTADFGKLIGALRSTQN